MKDKGQRQKKFKEKLKFYWIRVGKHIALIAVLLAYAFAGAPLFLFLEKPEEIRRYELAISQSAERQANFTAEFGRIFNSCRNSSDCENLIAHVVYEYELQLGMLKNGSAYDWDFWNSMFYAGTIVK